MNSRKALVSICGTAAALVSATEAASVPWIGVMNKGSALAIPAGKILIIQNIGPSGPGIIRMIINGTATGGIGSGGFSAPCVIASEGEGGQQLIAPIRLGPGMTLIHNSGPSFTIYGIAMDTGDFFAAVSPQIRGLAEDGTRMTAVIDTRSTAPTRVTGQSSTDLLNWSAADVTVARSRSNPRLAKISTPMTDPAKFLRAIVKPEAAPPMVSVDRG